MAQTKKDKALERLRKALDEIPELKQLRNDSPQFEKWRRDTRVAITKTFGNDSNHIADFENVQFFPNVFNAYDSELQEAYAQGLESAKAILESMIDEIEEYWEDENQAPTLSQIHENERIDSNEVFIIHGRDNEAKETVARLLTDLSLTPVILHEQPNQGRTIIEKFEEHAQVGFAVVLLTPDDVGSLKGEESNLKPRARQNVIFEFGYFIGHLGRKRVCALVKGNVEKPSDYDGVVYVPLDDHGAWKMKLVKELKAAGFDVDANRAL